MVDTLLTEQEAAEYLAVSTGSLRQKRYRGEDPPYIRLGRLVRYRRADLDAWINASVVTPQGA